MLPLKFLIFPVKELLHPTKCLYGASNLLLRNPESNNTIGKAMCVPLAVAHLLLTI